MRSDERRAHQRFQIWIPGLLTVMAPNRPELIRQRPVTVVDLSERGAMVSLRTEPDFCRIVIEENRRCRLEFAPSSGLPTELLGRVVWAQPAQESSDDVVSLGLFFEDLPSETGTAIRHYLEQVTAGPT